MIKVLFEDGSEMQVNGRTGAMMEYLARRSDRINEMECGHIEFAFKNKSLKPSIREVDELTVQD